MIWILPEGCEGCGEREHDLLAVWRARFAGDVGEVQCCARRLAVPGEFGVVGGGVVGELVFRHSPTCQLVSDHRGK